MHVFVKYALTFDVFSYLDYISNGSFCYEPITKGCPHAALHLSSIQIN